MSSYPPPAISESGPLVSRGDTGLSARPEESLRLVEVRIDNYLISVAVDANGHFRGITRIAAAGDFLTPMQRLASTGFHDVDQFYRDSEP